MRTVFRSLTVLLCAEALLVAAMPLTGRSRDTDPLMVPEERDERRVGELSETEGPFGFVRQLQNELAYPDGQPKNPERDPTDIWYILDKDVMQGNYRESLHSVRKCSSAFKFVFAWEELVQSCEKKVLPVESAMLRVYLQAVPRLLNGKSAEVDISTEVGSLRRNGSATNGSTVAGHDQITISRSSNEWIEFNITDGIRAIWPPSRDQPHVEVTVTMRVNCRNQKKVPANLVDPASIDLSKPKRRERHARLQPMLLIITDDKDVKQRIKEDKEDLVPETNVLHSDNRTLSNRSDRKRSINGPCDVDDFVITFMAIGLPHFRFPISYNARKCSGSCQHTTLKREPSLGNNHAKIMASAHVASILSDHTLFSEIPPVPCCVPTRYSPISVIMQTREGWKSQVFASMRVEECKCR